MQRLIFTFLNLINFRSRMPFGIITIPFDPEKECFLEEDLNNFCLNKKIKNFKAEFFMLKNKPYWTVFIEYEVVMDEDEREKSFSEAQSLLYQRLKEWRREKAEELGVPVYIIATNSELKQIVIQSPKTIEALKRIKGFGKKKIEKHGKEIIQLIKNFYHR